LLALLLFPAFLFAHPPLTPSPRTGKAIRVASVSPASAATSRASPVDPAGHKDCNHNVLEKLF